MLSPGAEKEVDKRIAKAFGAFTPERDMKADFRYIDQDDVSKAAAKSKNYGATPEGFVEYTAKPPIVYINRNTKAEGTLEHETLHLYGLKLLSYYGVGSDKVSHVFEGLTEYFTRQIFDGPRKSYQGEFRAIQKLADVVGETRLRKFFFQAQAGTLIDCLGQDLANDWKKQVNDQNWSDAEALLKNVKCKK